MAAAELGPVSLGVQGMAHCPAQSCQDLAAGFGRSGMALTRVGERETETETQRRKQRETETVIVTERSRNKDGGRDRERQKAA